MTRLLLLSFCLLVLAPLPVAACITGQPDNWHREQPETHDLASICHAGVFKVLVNQGRNSSGEVKGKPIGAGCRRLRAFEQYLNSRSPSTRNLTLEFVPKSRDRLLAVLQRNEGDLVAPGELLSVHDGLQVSPNAPVRADVPPVLVARKGNRRYTHLKQLSGQTIPLPAGSTAEGVTELVNQRLVQRRMASIRTEKLDVSLAVGDVMETVRAGILGFAVVE